MLFAPGQSSYFQQNFIIWRYYLQQALYVVIAKQIACLYSRLYKLAYLRSFKFLATIHILGPALNGRSRAAIVLQFIALGYHVKVRTVGTQLIIINNNARKCFTPCCHCRTIHLSSSPVFRNRVKTRTYGASSS